MKKIIFILALVLASVVSMGQTKHNQGVRIGPEGVGATIDSVKDENNQLAPYVGGSRDSFFNDSIYTLSEYIGELLTDLLTLTDRVEALENANADTTSPVMNYGEVFESTPNKWVLVFNEALITTGDSIDDAFTLTENGAAVSIDSFNVSVNVLNLYTSAVSGGTTLRASYDEPVSGGVRDLAGNTLNSFVDSTVRVFNKVLIPIDYLFYLKGNGDFTDEGDRFNGTKYGTVDFDGDSCFLFSGSGGTDYIKIPDPGITGDFSVRYRAWFEEDANDVWYVWSNGNEGGSESGISSKADGDGASNYFLFVRSGNGASTSWAQGVNGDISEDTWHNIVEVYDVNIGGSAASCEIWVDGVMVNSADTTFTITLDYTGDIYLGSMYTPAFGMRNGAKLDEITFFNYRLSPALIDSLNTNPFRMPFREVDTGGGTGNDSAYIIKFGVDYSTAGVGPLDNADLTSLFGYTSYFTDSRNYSNTVVIDNDTCQRFYTEAGDITNSQIYIILDSAYEELYFTLDFKVRDGMIIHPDYPEGDATTYSDYGGKLWGGLTSTSAYTSTRIVPWNLSDPTEGSFSTRINWYGESGALNSYTIDQTPGLTTSYHIPFGYTPWTVEDSACTGNNCYSIYQDVDWVNMTVRVSMNDATVGSYNGILNVYAGDSCIFSKNNMRWRGNSNVGIDIAWLLYLWGGQGRPIVDEYIDIDNVILWRYADNIPGSPDYPTVKFPHQGNVEGDKIPLPAMAGRRVE